MSLAEETVPVSASFAVPRSVMPTRGEEFEKSVSYSNSYLILESSGLLLEPCCFEVVDDIRDAPIGRVWQLTVFHGAVGGEVGWGWVGIENALCLKASTSAKTVALCVGRT